MKKFHMNISPFNEFALGSCFEDAYIPAFDFLEGDAFHYILNKCYYFRFMNNYFCISGFSMKKRQEIEEEYGLEGYKKTEKLEHVSDYIMECLQKQKLIICRTVNAVAYNPVTKRKTQKSFFPHWILLYGYDAQKREFDVLEHETVVAAQYKPHKMHFDDLEKGYLDAYSYDNNESNLYVLSHKHDRAITKEESCFSQYKMKCHEIQDYIASSRVALNRHFEELKHMSLKVMNEHQEIVLLSELIKYYQRESWLQEKAGISFECKMELLKVLNLLRTYCIKYMDNQSEGNRMGIIKYCELSLKLTNTWYEELDHYFM